MFKKSQPTALEKAEPKKWLTEGDKKAVVGGTPKDGSKDRLLNVTAIFRQGKKR